MDHPAVRTLMATAFTVVMVVVTFVAAGLTVGNLIGRLGMVTILLVSAVGWWFLAQKLFRVTERR